MALLNDEELRDLAIDLLRAESKRDKQKRLGASDLANQCDRCLAMKFAGLARPEPIQSARLWLGAILGTSIHGELEGRIRQHSTDIESPLFDRVTRTYSEMRHPICDIDGYGTVYGTIDWTLDSQVVDWKGSTRKKSALLKDFLAITQGQAAPYGRGNRHIKLSEREYNEQMAGMTHKVGSYFSQLQLYGHARARAGRPVERVSIMWINRDGNGYFDLPYAERYNDPKAMHDVWPLTFDYSEDAARGVIARAQGIHDLVASGTSPTEFEQATGCWVCSNEEQISEEIAAAPAVIHFGDMTIPA